MMQKLPENHRQTLEPLKALEQVDQRHKYNRYVFQH